MRGSRHAKIPREMSGGVLLLLYPQEMKRERAQTFFFPTNFVPFSPDTLQLQKSINSRRISLCGRLFLKIGGKTAKRAKSGS